MSKKEVEKEMKVIGFHPVNSGGNCIWYVKEITYKNKNAFIAITDSGGGGVLESFNDSIYVGIYDLDNDAETFCEPKYYKYYKSLNDYLNK